MEVAEYPLAEFSPAEGLWLPTSRFKEICVASPKTGKTGSIAALCNAGYRVILAAFDPGYDILLNTINPAQQENLIILPFEDRRGFQGENSKLTVATLGAPTAFAKFAEFLNTGLARRAPCQGGGIINLGPSETWKSDTFLVVDNLSSMAKAAFNRLLAQVGMNRNSRRRKDWGLAADEVDDVLIQLASSYYTYHLIVLAHWYTQGPREWEDEDRKDPEKSAYNNELREREKDLIPTKQVPISIGRQLSRSLLQHFPCVCWAEIDANDERIFNLAPSAVRDSGVPVRPGTLPMTLPIESGQLSLFYAVTGKPAAGSE